MQDDFWEQNAAEWNQVIEAGVFKSRLVTNAAIESQIKRHNLKSLLDIGCGEGWIARTVDLKSCQYLGVDGSESLIDIAQKKHKASFAKVTYEEIRRGQWKPNIQYDGIVFNFSLLEENITDLLQATSQFLNPEGIILIQTLHPCFALSKYQDSWNTEDFKSSGIKFKSEMPWYGRTLGKWTQVFSSSGLSLKEIIEPINEEKPASIIFILKKETPSQF